MTPNANHAGDWQAVIRELAAFDRPSASDGERRGAELIAERLRALGCRAEIEEERAHGGYWWPIGLVNAVAAAGGVLALRKRNVLTRAIAAGVAGVGAAALWDDLGHGRSVDRLDRRHGCVRDHARDAHLADAPAPAARTGGPRASPTATRRHCR